MKIIETAKSAHFAYVLNFLNEIDLLGSAKLLDIKTESQNEYAVIRANETVRNQIADYLNADADDIDIIDNDTFAIFVSPYDINENRENVLTFAS